MTEIKRYHRSRQVGMHEKGRDPRINPEVGDTLWNESNGESRRVHFVQRLDGKEPRVFWSHGEGFQHASTISEWRDWAYKANIQSWRLQVC